MVSIYYDAGKDEGQLDLIASMSYLVLNDHNCYFLWIRLLLVRARMIGKIYCIIIFFIFVICAHRLQQLVMVKLALTSSPLTAFS